MLSRHPIKTQAPTNLRGHPAHLQELAPGVCSIDLINSALNAIKQHDWPDPHLVRLRAYQRPPALISPREGLNIDAAASAVRHAAIAWLLYHVHAILLLCWLGHPFTECCIACYC